ncbi:hypothetical protein [Prochlorothrix hollandica]|uniref:Tetratricopeptide repeat protein n=1 Tax=Prochlorothrix hollandica PCC 9006 = CALU 1027 TaxID=317619 RepID=A0A0M2PVM3_PROHO|nr:hypothetical protein [Prochlorothrix hollandica]KKJ00215.1 hypothetical protein PROH_10985 [Prochlorothrix hollandica PCC 9006 = CALU 1027]
MTQRDRELAQDYYTAGKLAFDGGRYRTAIEAYEAAIAHLNPNTPLGGEVQLALVMAYEGGGNLDDARNLCRKLSKHPDAETRKQSSQVLFILEAPRLTTRPEWVVDIPDLSAVDDSDAQYQRSGGTPTLLPPNPPPTFLDPTPLNLAGFRPQMNRLLWFLAVMVAIGATVWLNAIVRP